METIMKRTGGLLIGLAAMSAHAQVPLFAAPGAVYTPGSVLIYGVADAGVVINPTTNGSGHSATKVSLQSGQSYGSQIGFAGSEDLGGGVSAVFDLENGYNIANGGFNQGGLLFGRQAYVGLLDQKFGALLLGRQYSPFFAINAAYDVFHNGTEGEEDNMTLGIARVDNAATYVLPNIGGLSGEVQYGFSSSSTSSSNGTIMGANLNYKRGPISLGAAYIRVHAGSVAYSPIAGNANPATALYGADIVPAGGNGQWWELAASYDAGFIKTNLTYNVQRGIEILNPSTGYMKPLGTATSNADAFYLGVGVPVGLSSFVGSATYEREKTEVEGKLPHAVQIALGFFYPLSKRTVLYTSAAKIFNRDGATFTVDNATNPGVLSGNGDSAGFSVGIRHQF
jgi:predicted porin